MSGISTVVLLNTWAAESTEHRATSEAAGRILISDDIRDHNTFEEPERVQPREVEISIEGGRVHHTLPAKSLTVLDIAL